MRLQFVELSGYPRLAGTNEVAAVPLLLMEGRRFLGAWDEVSLVRQLTLVARGDSTYRELCFTCHGTDGKGAPVAGAAEGPRAFSSSRLRSLIRQTV